MSVFGRLRLILLMTRVSLEGSRMEIEGVNLYVSAGLVVSNDLA
jgi:hypothetical protein